MKNTYGLTPEDLKYCRDKIDGQKSYLANNHFHTSTGQVKSLLDVSFSANISERYYAQLSNKINTMHSLAMSYDLKPTFLTITIDGFFRDFIKGDFTRWHKKTDLEKEEYLRHIPNNETYGYLRQKIKEKKKFTVKDCYNVLSFQWYRFSAGYAFKKLRKEDQEFIYLKAAEPHKDGVPHFHVLLWVSPDYFDNFKNDFKRYFPAPRNHEVDKDSKEGDTVGFQTAINNPVGYIMKYATKSFMNIKNDDELDYLQAWYVKHKIRRITTSHSTIPQWVYQKLFAVEADWFHLTDSLVRHPMLCEWNKKENQIMVIEECGRVLEYDNGVLTVKSLGSDSILRQIGTPKEKVSISSVKYEPVPSTWKMPPPPNKIIDAYIDGTHFLYKNELLKFEFDLKPIESHYINQKYYFYRPKMLINLTPQPIRMSDFELWNYYHDEIDMDTVNAHHYAHTHNQMIERDLITGEIIPLNANIESELWGYDNDL